MLAVSSNISIRQNQIDTVLVCHSEERSDVAISLPQKRPMSRRDCHATLAMTAWQKLDTRKIPIADHRRSADPLPTEPVPPQHRSTHHHQQRTPSGVQRRCCHKRRRELHGRRRNPRTTHPRDANRRRGHRPTLRPSHRPPNNFYEDWYDTGRVERGLRDIETLLDKLQTSVNE